MTVTQEEYERVTREELAAAATEIREHRDLIENSARTGNPLSIAPKEFLKKLATATRKAQSVIEEHASGDHFSDDTLQVAASVLRDIHQGMDSLIFHWAIQNVRLTK